MPILDQSRQSLQKVKYGESQVQGKSSLEETVKSRENQYEIWFHCWKEISDEMNCGKPIGGY